MGEKSRRARRKPSYNQGGAHPVQPFQQGIIAMDQHEPGATPGQGYCAKKKNCRLRRHTDPSRGRVLEIAELSGPEGRPPSAGWELSSQGLQQSLLRG